VHGYKIQVQVHGYASAVGPLAFNEALSAQRADNVVAVLAQSGGVPLTNVLVPGAMGISEQVAENKTAKGQGREPPRRRDDPAKQGHRREVGRVCAGRARQLLIRPSAVSAGSEQ
jgi:OmpA family protein